MGSLQGLVSFLKVIWDWSESENHYKLLLDRSRSVMNCVRTHFHRNQQAEPSASMAKGWRAITALVSRRHIEPELEATSSLGDEDLKSSAQACREKRKLCAERRSTNLQQAGKSNHTASVEGGRSPEDVAALVSIGTKANLPLRERESTCWIRHEKLG